MLNVIGRKQLENALDWLKYLLENKPEERTMDSRVLDEKNNEQMNTCESAKQTAS